MVLSGSEVGSGRIQTTSNAVSTWSLGGNRCRSLPRLGPAKLPGVYPATVPHHHVDPVSLSLSNLLPFKVFV